MEEQRFITLREHEEFCKTIKAEHENLAAEDKRQNQRIGELEETVRQIGALTTSVEKLAVSMESMVKEQEQQGRRLETLESQNGEVETLRQISAVTASVEKLAANVESAARTQEQQAKQLRDLEAKDGEMWRKVTAYIATAVIGIVIGFIFRQIGM